MAGRLVIFAGAPEPDNIAWDEKDLLSSFQQPIASFAGLATPKAPAIPSGTAPIHAAWRSIPLERPHLHTGFSQVHVFGDLQDKPDGAHDFLTTTLSFTTTSSDDSGADVSREMLSQFYEHSLAVHEDVPSSQLVASSAEEQNETSYLGNDTSFNSDAHPRSQPREPANPRGGGHLSDLEDIPPPAYLTSIQPQTMTVDIIVGIISIAAPRSVQTRWGSPRTLVEVLVGDDTRSGFTITFWIPSEDISKSVLAGLRPQDVVLMQNVALTVFMKKVYGSSLRKNLTGVHLLYRKRLDSGDVGGHYSSADLAVENAHPQLEKTRKVREWVLQFVGIPAAPTGPAVKEGRAWDQPPPDDTQ
ncbi:hypothetical protein GQ53DRAFT_498410 [Thozetella sp. PMI_491]|nr:hypothetical protein GQ53DRAFT_498410 [Thozetella sp. PMI_491]